LGELAEPQDLMVQETRGLQGTQDLLVQALGLSGLLLLLLLLHRHHRLVQGSAVRGTGHRLLDHLLREDQRDQPLSDLEDRVDQGDHHY